MRYLERTRMGSDERGVVLMGYLVPLQTSNARVLFSEIATT